MSAPEGFATVTPVLIVNNAAGVIDSYKDGLDAEIMGILNCPKTGKVLHACIKIGSSTLFISDIFPEMGERETGRQEFYIYVENVEAAIQKAKAAGFNEIQEPQEMFWGDRVSKLTDENGNTWSLAQKVRDVSPEEIDSAVKQMMK
jgi:PhnB protein